MEIQREILIVSRFKILVFALLFSIGLTVSISAEDSYFEVTYNLWQRNCYSEPLENIDPTPTPDITGIMIQETYMLFGNPTRYPICGTILAYRQDGFMANQYDFEVPASKSLTLSLGEIIATGGNLEQDVLFWQTGWLKVIWHEPETPARLSIFGLGYQNNTNPNMQTMKAIYPSNEMEGPIYVPGVEINQQANIDTYISITNPCKEAVNFEVIIYDEAGESVIKNEYRSLKIEPGINYVLSAKEIIELEEVIKSEIDKLVGYAKISPLDSKKLNVSAFVASRSDPFINPGFYRAIPVTENGVNRSEIPFCFKGDDTGATNHYFDTWFTVSNPRSTTIDLTIITHSRNSIKSKTQNVKLEGNSTLKDDFNTSGVGCIEITSNEEFIVNSYMDMYPKPTPSGPLSDCEPLASNNIIPDKKLMEATPIINYFSTWYEEIDPTPTPTNNYFSTLYQKNTSILVPTPTPTMTPIINSNDTLILFYNKDPRNTAEVKISMYLNPTSTPSPDSSRYRESFSRQKQPTPTPTQIPIQSPFAQKIISIRSNDYNGQKMYGLLEENNILPGSNEGYIIIERNAVHQISTPLGYQIFQQNYYPDRPTPTPGENNQSLSAFANLTSDIGPVPTISNAPCATPSLSLESFGCFIKATWSGGCKYFDIEVDAPGNPEHYFILKEKCLENQCYVFAPVDGEYSIRVTGYNECIQASEPVQETLIYLHPENKYVLLDTFTLDDGTYSSKKIEVNPWDGTPAPGYFPSQKIVYLTGESIEEIYTAYGYLMAEEILDSIYDFYDSMENHLCIQMNTAKCIHKVIEEYFPVTPQATSMISETSKEYLGYIAEGIREYYDGTPLPTFAPPNCLNNSTSTDPTPLPTYSLSSDSFLLDLAMLNLADELCMRGHDHCQVADFFGPIEGLEEESNIGHDVMQTLMSQYDNMGIMVYNYDFVPTPVPPQSSTPTPPPNPQNNIMTGMVGMIYPAGVGYTENNLHFSGIMSSLPRFSMPKIPTVAAATPGVRLNMDEYREVIERAENVPTAVAMCEATPSSRNFNTKCLHFAGIDYDSSISHQRLLDTLALVVNDEYTFETGQHIAHEHQNFEYGDINLYKLMPYNENLPMIQSAPHERIYNTYEKYLIANPTPVGSTEVIMSPSQIYQTLYSAEPNAVHQPLYYDKVSFNVYDILHINQKDASSGESSDIFYIGNPGQNDINDSAMEPHNVYRHDFNQLMEGCLFSGDVNGDGIVSAGDAQLAGEFVIGTYEPDFNEICAADCDGSKVITKEDVQAIFDAAIGGDPCIEGEYLSSKRRLGNVNYLKFENAKSSIDNELWMDYSISSNDILIIDIYIHDNSKEISSFTLDFSYNSEALEYTGCAEGKLNPQWDVFDCNVQTPGEITAGGFVMDSAIITHSEGSLVTLMFNMLSPDSVFDEFPVKITGVADDLYGFNVLGK